MDEQIENLNKKSTELNLIIQTNSKKVAELEAEKQKNLCLAKQSEKLITELTGKLEEL